MKENNNIENNFLTVSGLCKYLDVSKSYVYKLSHNNILPKYNPSHKLVYFKLSDVDAWLHKHRISSRDEIESAVEHTFYKKKIKRC
jgi:excisionase family DNA binding protein